MYVYTKMTLNPAASFCLLALYEHSFLQRWYLKSGNTDGGVCIPQAAEHLQHDQCLPNLNQVSKISVQIN